ncbi:MAG TPA: hypothetical protein VFJ77_06295 [Gaiellaceae bacterium]|nr:hypothetical protein [Gaiellaceae bacterium]
MRTSQSQSGQRKSFALTAQATTRPTRPARSRQRQAAATASRSSGLIVPMHEASNTGMLAHAAP